MSLYTDANSMDENLGLDSSSRKRLCGVRDVPIVSENIIRDLYDENEIFS